MSQVRAIHLKDDRSLYHAGDTIEGIVELCLPRDVPICNVSISFHCIGKVKWTGSYAQSPFHLDSHVQYTQHEYYHKVFSISNEDIYEKPNPSEHDHKNVFIQFWIYIPTNKNLPSSVVCRQSFIEYFIRVFIKDGDKIQKFKRTVIVQSDIERQLMIAISKTIAKTVLLHIGRVTMKASLSRQGYAPGETITVHILVNNQSNASTLPRISLHQMQSYTSAKQHNTLKVVCNDRQFVTGLSVQPHTKMEQLVGIAVPRDESLTIESALINVQYFVHVTVDIPHSFDLHVNIPVVIVSSEFIENLRDINDNVLPEFV